MTPEMAGAAVAQLLVELTKLQKIPISKGRHKGAKNLRFLFTNGYRKSPGFPFHHESVVMRALIELSPYETEGHLQQRYRLAPVAHYQ